MYRQSRTSKKQNVMKNQNETGTIQCTIFKKITMYRMQAVSYASDKRMLRQIPSNESIPIQ